MQKKYLKEKLEKVACSLYDKDLLGIHLGSISFRSESAKFVINKREAFFNQLDSDSMIELHFQTDYRYNQASKDATIHQQIYHNFLDAKFVLFVSSAAIITYTLKHDILYPKDFFAKSEFGILEIYDIGDTKSWKQRKNGEIMNYFKEQDKKIMLIRGYGVYIYGRDIYEMVRKIEILERSCKVLGE